MELDIPLVYIAGAYTAEHQYQVKLNIQRAEHVGMDVAKMGASIIVPHTNTAHWEGIQSPKWFYKATLKQLSKCDAMVVVPDKATDSVGTIGEIEYAEKNGIPWFWGTEVGLANFEHWLNTEWPRIYVQQQQPQ